MFYVATTIIFNNKNFRFSLSQYTSNAEIIIRPGDVICYQNTACFSDNFTVAASSEEDCCRHGVPPFGVAFQFPEHESCNPCPIGEFADEPQLLMPECNFRAASVKYVNSLVHA